MSLIAESQDYTRGGTQKDVYTADEVVAVACPACGGEERRHVYTEHGAVVVSRCRSCSLIYTSSRIKAPEQVYWGDADLYYAEARLIFEGKAAHHRDPNYREELGLIRHYKPGGRILDVGCNMGMLLRLARRLGWDVVGLEPSPSLSRLAARHGFPVHNCFLHELPAAEENSFDVIALSDVFEHVCDPLGMLADVSRFLKPDGVLYVKVPNARWNLFKQSVFRLLGRAPRQGLWDSYEHVVHYTEPTLRAMLERGKFRPLRVTTGRPVQTPVWHEYVGHYYQYPCPWFLDARRHVGRSACHQISRVERLARLGSIGYLAQNLVAVAAKS